LRRQQFIILHDHDPALGLVQHLDGPLELLDPPLVLLLAEEDPGRSARRLFLVAVLSHNRQGEFRESPLADPPLGVASYSHV
jgi:hypothetical protein